MNHFRIRITAFSACLLLSLGFATFARAQTPQDEAPAADEPAALENPLGPDASYGATLRGLVDLVREKVVVRLEEKTLAKQEAKMGRLSLAFFVLSLGGGLLLLSPFFFRPRRSGQLGTMFKYALLSAALFFVAVNVFSTMLLLMKGVQDGLGRLTNPQIALVEATFDGISHQAEGLKSIGPTLIEPTLNQLSDESDESPPVALLENVQRLKADAAVFVTLAQVLKSLNWVFGSLPILFTVLAVALFVRSTKQTLVDVVWLPRTAAEGGDVGLVVKRVFTRAGHEALATACTLVAVVVVSVLGGVFLRTAVEPGVEAFLDYLFLAVMYLQTSHDFSSTLVFVSLGATVLFLVLNMALVLVSSSFVLGKVQKIFQQRFHEGTPLSAHAPFWKWGPAAMVWSLLYPVLFITAAEPVVEKLVALGAGPGEPSWGALLLVGPLSLLALFVGGAWAARVFKGLWFVKRYDPVLVSQFARLSSSAATSVVLNPAASASLGPR